MMPQLLSQEDRLQLLKLARQALEDGIRGKTIHPLKLDELSPHLQEPGASFVTLMCKGELRGCIGSLDVCQPLVEDVRDHVLAAALQDYRFPPVTIEELSDITIEISRLTPPQRIEYENSNDLLSCLHPKIDGVVVRDGERRATFLPQVWEKICDTELFLSHLCLKMGAPHDLWKRKKLEIYVYQVEKFCE